MSDHPDRMEKPPFSFSILGIYRDCLSRQVAEALRIVHTKDVILNSKNEYLDNNIPRITVDESKVDRMRRERAEKERELKDLRDLEEFKLKHRKAQKRNRNMSNHQGDLEKWIQPAKKRLREEDTLQLHILDNFCLGEWLDRNERLCQRVGDLKERLLLDKSRTLRRMDCYGMDLILDDLTDWWERQEHLLHRDLKSEQMNTSHLAEEIFVSTAGDANKPPEVNDTVNIHIPGVERKKIKNEYNLVGFVGWLRRIERAEESFWKGVRSSNSRRLEGARRINFLNSWKVSKIVSEKEKYVEKPESGTNPHCLNSNSKRNLDNIIWEEGTVFNSPNKRLRDNLSFNSSDLQSTKFINSTDPSSQPGEK